MFQVLITACANTPNGASVHTSIASFPDFRDADRAIAQIGEANAKRSIHEPALKAVPLYHRTIKENETVRNL